MARSLEQRLDEAESRIAIAELIHAYARFIRRDEPDQVHTLFTSDGTFELREGHPDKAEFDVKYRLEGRESVRAQMSHNKGNAHPVPLIHNLIVEVGSDSATATCVMEGKIYGTSHGILGEYNDSFRREGGKWLFAARVFTLFRGASQV